VGGRALDGRLLRSQSFGRWCGDGVAGGQQAREERGGAEVYQKTTANPGHVRALVKRDGLY
jgi:hypothetical protein